DAPIDSMLRYGLTIKKVITRVMERTSPRPKPSIQGRNPEPCGRREYSLSPPSIRVCQITGKPKIQILHNAHIARPINPKIAEFDSASKPFAITPIVGAGINSNNASKGLDLDSTYLIL
ncbi:MAG: hypothetical protein VYB27_02790, partial [Candidatus Thermoplasmatota archaeon]|nr:hypothetical protein [Candidatus Thermoplasmatota archaeon]